MAHRAANLDLNGKAVHEDDMVVFATGAAGGYPVLRRAKVVSPSLPMTPPEPHEVALITSSGRVITRRCIDVAVV